MGKRLSTQSVRQSYERLTPVYDLLIGAIAKIGCRRAAERVNKRAKGRVLEVGVGTGIGLPYYGSHLKIIGVDLSPNMLRKARRRVEKLGLKNVESLREMDATQLEFPDESFDVVVASYLITVVPEPKAVMREMERVCKPGGEVILVNHLTHHGGVLFTLEQIFLKPFAGLIGWNPGNSPDEIKALSSLKLVEESTVGILNWYTLLRYAK